jgi:hypothetical protein
MADHSEHYPTMIENPKTKQRVQVKTPLEHHKQLLAWKQPGLQPAPAEAVQNPQPGPTSEPGYPTMIENEKTGERVRVDSKADHDAQVQAWDAAAKQTKSTTRTAAPPPAPKPATGTARASAAKQGSGKPGTTSGKMPPTKEDFMKKNYPESIAQKMADEEVRKYNAGEAPYGKG